MRPVDGQSVRTPQKSTAGRTPKHGRGHLSKETKEVNDRERTRRRGSVRKWVVGNVQASKRDGRRRKAWPGGRSKHPKKISYVIYVLSLSVAGRTRATGSFEGTTGTRRHFVCERAFTASESLIRLRLSRESVVVRYRRQRRRFKSWRPSFFFFF